MTDRRWIAACVAFAATVLSGCVSVMDMAGIQRAGHQSDGSYVVSAEQEGLACRQIRDRLDMLSRDIKALPQQAALEERGQPSTVGAIFARVFGEPGDGIKAVADYRKATAESDALNALYIRKQCV